jgi:hypothetical protein
VVTRKRLSVVTSTLPVLWLLAVVHVLQNYICVVRISNGITLRTLLFTAVRWFLDTFAKLGNATISFVMSVSPFVRTKQLGPHQMDFDKIWYLTFVWKSGQKIQDSFNSIKMTATLHEDIFTFTRVCRWILLKMRNVSNKRYIEN